MLPNNALINRMEILYPNEKKFTALRLAYFNHHKPSIIRLLAYQHDVKIKNIKLLDDVSKDLYSLFDRVEENYDIRESEWIDQGDLRKFIFHDNEWSLYRLLLDVRDNQIVRTIKSLHASGIQWNGDAMSQGQLKSKMWMINELKILDLDLGTVFLCAGWYGLLATLMFEHDLKVDRVRSFDIDPDVVTIADKFNLPWFSDTWKLKAVTEDIHNIDFVCHNWRAWSSSNERMSYPITDVPNTVINTSCEHIEDFATWYAKIPADKLVILQSNNYDDIDEHVNTSPDLDSFSAQTPMTEVLYSGGLDLLDYTRFMRI